MEWLKVYDSIIANLILCTDLIFHLVFSHLHQVRKLVQHSIYNHCILLYQQTRQGKLYIQSGIYAEKAFDKIKNPFLTKILSNLKIDGSFLNVIKDLCRKPTVSIIISGETLTASPPKILGQRKGRMSVLTTFQTNF